MKGAITVRAFFSLASVALMLAAMGISPAMAAGTASAGPATTAGADLLRLRVAIDERCFQGRGIAGAIHTVSLRAADGQLRARQIVRPDAQGDFSACFPEGFTVNPTDVTTLRTAGLRARARIPDLRPFISRSAETVRGTGRPGDVLKICVQDNPGPTGDTSFCYERVVSADGRWRLDISGLIDIQGTTAVSVQTRRGNVSIRVSTSAPYVSVSPQTNLVTGRKKPFQTARFELIDASGDTLATAVDPRAGNRFEAALVDDRGRPVYPRAGDRLRASIAGGLTLRIPSASLVADRSADVVRGRCMPGADYFVTVHRGREFPYYIDGSTGAGGLFLAAGDEQLRLDAKVDLFCSYSGLDRLVMTTEVRP